MPKINRLFLTIIKKTAIFVLFLAMSLMIVGAKRNFSYASSINNEKQDQIVFANCLFVFMNSDKIFKPRVKWLDAYDKKDISLGVFRETLQVNDIVYNDLKSMKKAFVKDNSMNVLAAPFFFIKDSGERSIGIGPSVPYSKAMGVVMKIKAHIVENRQMRLIVKMNFLRQSETLSEKTFDFIVNDKNSFVIAKYIGNDFFADDLQVADDKLFIFVTPYVITDSKESQDTILKKSGYPVTGSGLTNGHSGNVLLSFNCGALSPREIEERPNFNH